MSEDYFFRLWVRNNDLHRLKTFGPGIKMLLNSTTIRKNTLLHLAVHHQAYNVTKYILEEIDYSEHRGKKLLQLLALPHF